MELYQRLSFVRQWQVFMIIRCLWTIALSARFHWYWYFYVKCLKKKKKFNFFSSFESAWTAMYLTPIKMIFSSFRFNHNQIEPMYCKGIILLLNFKQMQLFTQWLGIQCFFFFIYFVPLFQSLSVVPSNEMNWLRFRPLKVQSTNMCTVYVDQTALRNWQISK